VSRSARIWRAWHRLFKSEPRDQRTPSADNEAIEIVSHGARLTGSEARAGESSARDMLEEVTLALQSIQNEIDSSARAEAGHERSAVHWLDLCQQSDYVNDLLEQLMGRLAAEPPPDIPPGPPPPPPPTAYAGASREASHDGSAR
jgi:hypothetical protein